MGDIATWNNAIDAALAVLRDPANEVSFAHEVTEEVEALRKEPLSDEEHNRILDVAEADHMKYGGHGLITK